MTSSMFVGSPAAHAGAGPSAWCSDGSGTEFPLLVTPYTLGAEIHQVGSSRTIRLCFATSPTSHSGSQIAGGAISYHFFNSEVASTACSPDSNTTVTVSCFGWTSLSSSGIYTLHFHWTTVDTTATEPVTLGTTGAVVFGPTLGVIGPCVEVNDVHLVPICGTILA